MRNLTALSVVLATMCAHVGAAAEQAQQRLLEDPRARCKQSARASE
jgi:hypothetical protein